MLRRRSIRHRLGAFGYPLEPSADNGGDAVASKANQYQWQRELARRPRDVSRLVLLLKSFTPVERARLRFARWLVATGRLAG